MFLNNVLLKLFTVFTVLFKFYMYVTFYVNFINALAIHLSCQ